MRNENNSTAADTFYQDIREQLYNQLGLPPSLLNTSTATGIYNREWYKHLFGRYPEEDKLISAYNQLDEKEAQNETT